MKKLLALLFGIITLLFVLTIIRPLFSRAQGCGGIMGSNVATNWYWENLEFIRNNAGCSGPIPIEVIITPAERDDHALLLELENNLRELNFIPTWRPWGNGMPQGEELQAWINAASVLTYGQFQLFSEPNNCYNGCFSGATPNPTADAAAALAFLQAKAGGDIKIPLVLMPLSPRTPPQTPGSNFFSEQEYWAEFNNACNGCVKNFDYIGLNIYPLTTPGTDPNENVNKFINDFIAQRNFFAGLGVDISTTRFLIVEAGLDPGSYNFDQGGSFEKRLRDTLALVNALEARISQDPTLFPNVDQITFFLMDHTTGKQYLIFRQCDAAGNCQWVVEGFLVYNPNVPPGWPLPYQLTCNPSNPGDQDSRPVPCDACNQTDLMTSSCATSFTVNDKVEYRRGDGEDKEPYCVETPWGGIVTIDPSDTTIPFVGKKGGEDEQKYLADYFEGTNKYYADYSDPVEAMNHEGVFRKLAPLQVQDDLKKEMVNRAIRSLSANIQEGAIHDYSVSDGTYSHQLSEFSGHFPPDDPKERGEWERETKWGRLWAAVPMFTREDTPGRIDPYLGYRPDDKFEIQNPEAQVEKVPHVARLYEVSQAINEIILPLIQGTGQTQTKIKTFLASAKEKVLGEKTFLAQAGGCSGAPGCFHLDAESVSFPQANGSIKVFVTVKVYSDGGDGHIQFFINGASQGTQWGWNKNKKDPYEIGPQYTDSPITVPRSGSVSMKYGVKIDECGYSGNCDEITCVFSVDADGNFSTNCGPGQPVSPPICELPGPIPVEGCEMPAITDPNPNDDLCCSPINIKLSALDIFENWEKPKCEAEGITCKPPGCTPGVDCVSCHDPCHEMVEKDVSRQVGIMLSHPYLSEIWEYTSDVFNGFFNIFRPETVPEFEDLAAASSIFYSYSPGSATPPGGDFYFPYLGGIQKAKEWVIEMLNPSTQ